VTAIRAIELFGCAGGMAEGFRRAGIEFTAAFDWNREACASYEANLGQRPIRMDVRDLLRLLEMGWSAPPLDLIVADPPCTPWSAAGRRQGLDDERDMLRATVGVILAARPMAYLIGNVPGLDHAPNLPALREVLAPLHSAGYCIGDYARLDAADYGVPQNRIRPFWFGHRAGECLSWPAPTHCDPKKLGLDVGLHRWRTCRDALGHLPLDELGTPVRLSRKARGDRSTDADLPAETIEELGLDELLLHPKHPVSELDEPARTQVVGNGGWNGASILCLQADHRPNHPDEPAHTVTTGNHGARDPMVTWPWDRPATTVTTRDTISAPGHHEHSGQFGPGAVKLSERARALLQSFPEGWEFVGRWKKTRSAQIGMAMPPPLAQAVATSIRAWFAVAQERAA